MLIFASGFAWAAKKTWRRGKKKEILEDSSARQHCRLSMLLKCPCRHYGAVPNWVKASASALLWHISVEKLWNMQQVQKCKWCLWLRCVDVPAPIQLSKHKCLVPFEILSVTSLTVLMVDFSISLASYWPAGAGVTVLLGSGRETTPSSCVLTVCCPSCMEMPARNNRDRGTAQPSPPQPFVEGAGSLQPCQPALRPMCIAE